MSPVMRNGENPRDHLLSSWMKTQRSSDCSSVVRVRIKEAIQCKFLFCVDTIVVSTVILLFLLHEESDLQSHSKTVFILLFFIILSFSRQMFGRAVALSHGRQGVPVRKQVTVAWSGEIAGHAIRI
jgi:hypothetical protein